MGEAAVAARKKFVVHLIKPSHYDKDGYVIQWWKAWIPSNSLASLYGLAQDIEERGLLGDDIDLEIDGCDEMNTVIPFKKIIKKIKAAGAGGLVGLVGVQSNQFPRALDIARQFREAGIQVCIGGFHVSGCISMLPELPESLQEALDMGISLYAGEAENRLDEVFNDAIRGEMKPIYNYLSDLPDLQGAVTPFLPERLVRKYDGVISAFDAGRGCPFQCSFCTIINVQGRKSRYRTADDIEGIVRSNLAQGVNRFFITDDNFARNKNWEGIFDRLIELREGEGLDIAFIIQVDTLCHQIPGFVAKAGRAGCTRVYIGLENINPDNLIAAKKRQNRITEYRKMLQMWKSVGAMTYCGYIIGFPGDTQERVLRDVEIIKNELPVDLLEFFCLTPLPGSEDHQILYKKGVWMDPDMNKYDLEHVCAEHPIMSREEWQETYHKAWDTYYTLDHMERIMRRAVACGMSPGKVLFLMLWFYGCKTFEGIHPLEGGYMRRRYRKDRRPGLPIESPLVFYPRHWWLLAKSHYQFLSLAWKLHRIRKRIKADPQRMDYTDLALSPVEETELDELALFTSSDSAKAVVEKKRQDDAAREAAKAQVVAAE